MLPVHMRLFPVANFFHTALVAHVDLSVLVWFVAFAGALWSLNSTSRLLPIGWAALAAAALGAATMAVAPFAPGTPIMANYVPVIESPAFLAGLALFGGGLALVVLAGFLAWLGTRTPSVLPAVALGNLLGGMALLGLLAWLWQADSRREAPPASLRFWIFAALALVALQIAFGGLIGARHAALACAGFPGCGDDLWPQGTDWRAFDPFLPNDGLGDASRQALHLAHRSSALLLAALVGGAMAAALLEGAGRRALVPFAIGLAAAVSLLPYLPLLLRVGEWRSLAHVPLTLADLAERALAVNAEVADPVKLPVLDRPK